jgi:hypothetical protein
MLWSLDCGSGLLGGASPWKKSIAEFFAPHCYAVQRAARAH